MAHSFIFLGFILALSKSIQGDLDTKGWRTNAVIFANQTIDDIKRLTKDENSLCSDVRKHSVLADTYRALKSFDSCDKNYWNENGNNDQDSCYFDSEKIFHTAVDNAKKPEICNSTNIFTYFATEIKKLEHEPSCLYFNSMDNLIEILSEYHFMKPTEDIMDSLNTIISRFGSRKIRTEKKLRDTLANAKLDNDFCKRKITQDYHRDKHSWQKPGCSGWIDFSLMKTIVLNCYRGPSLFIQKFKEEVDKEKNIRDLHNTFV